VPPHVAEVGAALENLHRQIQQLWSGNGIDGRQVARLLGGVLPSWDLERSGSRQALTWDDAGVKPFLVDGQRDSGRSIIEIEGGGALQNNRLHRDLLNAMLLDDVEYLVLVVPNWVHNRSPFEYATAFATRLRAKQILPRDMTTTIFGYGSPPGRSPYSRGTTGSRETLDPPEGGSRRMSGEPPHHD
jgi:hypothetical protein